MSQQGVDLIFNEHVSAITKLVLHYYGFYEIILGTFTNFKIWQILQFDSHSEVKLPHLEAFQCSTMILDVPMTINV